MSNLIQIRLVDLITDQANAALKRQNIDGSMPAGCNGPYHDAETPVRNTAHWLITLSWLYYIHSDQRYLDAAHRLATYLSDPAHRPYGFSFDCRRGAADHCNGLIGQAWAMEGLVEATRLFQDNRFSRIALDVFNKHKFDYRCGLWNRLEPNGQDIGRDLTFNHQLWFAVTAAELFAVTNDKSHPHLNRFMDMLKSNLNVSTNGRIRHLIYRTVSGIGFKRTLRHTFGPVFKLLGAGTINDKINYREQITLKREVGYQSFNIYAFARLARIFNTHPIFESIEFKKAFIYLESDEYMRAVGTNPYSYGYNPPGFEVPLCLSTFSNKERSVVLHKSEYWIQCQLALTYNTRTLLFDRNTNDPETLGARIYECTRFPEDILFLKVDVKIDPTSLNRHSPHPDHGGGDLDEAEEV